MNDRDPPDAPVAARRLVAALAVAWAAWLPALAAIVLSIVYGLPVVGRDEFMSLYLLNAIVWGGVSALLIARRPNPVGAITALTAIGSGVSAIVRQLVRSPLGTGIDPGIAEHVLDRVWMPGTLATLSILPLLLTSRPLGPRTRALVGLGIAAAVAPFLVSFVRQKPGAADNPLGIDDPVVQDVVVAVFEGSLALSVALAVVTAAMLLWRWRLGPLDDRRGTGWLVIGQVALIVLFGPTFLPRLPISSQEIFQFIPLAPVLGLLFMAAAVVAVALGARLWGIESTVNRIVADGLLLVVILLTYVSLAVPLSTALPVPPTIAGVAGVVAFALALQPLRRLVRRRVDALVFGDAADPAQLLARVGSVRSDGDVLQTLLAEVRSALRLDGLEVGTGDPGRDQGRRVVLPLRGAGGVLGWVRATPRGRQRLDQRTRSVLEGISGVLAVARQLDEAHRELGEARDRALSVADEERRMLRRELHDGLGPALATASARLSDLAAHWPADPGRARSALADIRTELARRTTDVRDLARTLLPGALDAGDLDTALRELGARFSTERLAISVDAIGAAELDASAQTAVHHLAAEAVLLLRRATGVRHAELRVEAGPEWIVIVLTADAAFVDRPDTVAPLRSIAGRARELGGRSSTDDPRTVRVEVPR